MSNRSQVKTKLDNSEVISSNRKLLLPLIIPTGHKIYHNIGDTVFLRTDNDQHARIVTGILLRPHKSVTYCLAFGVAETWHHKIEISSKKNELKALL